MKAILTFCLMLAMNLTSDGQILPGQAPMLGGDEMLIGARWRNLHPTNSLAGDELYLGIPDLGIAANRNTANFTYSPIFNISFSYDAVNNSITAVTTLASSVNTLTKINISNAATAAGKTRPLSSMNIFQLRIRNRVPASTTTVSNITLNGFSVPGFFSNSGNNSNLYWYGYSSLYGSSFTFTAQVQLAGNYNSSGENNVVELLFGSSSAVLPIQSVQKSISHSNGRNNINVSVVSNEPLQKATLYAGKDGVHFTAIDSISQPAKSFSFIDLNYANQYYYVKVSSVTGSTVFSKIEQIVLPKNAVPVKIVNTSSVQLTITTQNGQLLAVKLYNSSGQLTYSKTGINNNQLMVATTKGMYIVHVIAEGKQYAEKVFVQ